MRLWADFLGQGSGISVSFGCSYPALAAWAAGLGRFKRGFNGGLAVRPVGAIVCRAALQAVFGILQTVVNVGYFLHDAAGHHERGA